MGQQGNKHKLSDDYAGCKQADSFARLATVFKYKPQVSTHVMLNASSTEIKGEPEL